MMRVKHVWDATIDRRVAAAIDELLVEFPDTQVSVRELQDDRGTVAIAVTVGDGRLVVSARIVELAPLRLPWDTLTGVCGVLPDREVPTVDEFVAGLVSVAECAS